MKSRQKNQFLHLVTASPATILLWGFLVSCGTVGSDQGQDLVTAEDTVAAVPYCGDGMCDSLEDPTLCPIDCETTQPSTGYCGDGTCQNHESGDTCSVDCGSGLAPNPSKQLMGRIEGVFLNGGVHQITGWACHLEWGGSIQLHVYVGGPAGEGLVLKGAVADEPNAEAVFENCLTNEGNHRFRIPLTATEIESHQGQPIYMYGISPVGNNNNPLGDSGLHLVPNNETLPETVCGDGKCEGDENEINCVFDCEDTVTPPPPPPDAIGKWRRKVLSFTTGNYSGNPFEIPIDGTFVHSQSGQSLTLPGYYDGDNTWKIGFMPTEVGQWTYTTSSPNGDLKGHTGTVHVVESGHQGLLAGDPAYPNKWRYADGDHIVPIGVFVNAMLEGAPAQEFTDMADFVQSHNLHFLNFRISEHDRAFEDVSAKTMHLPRWRRLEKRMEILTERGLGVDIMLYTDDDGKPSFGAQSPQEQMLIRYTVARLCGFPTVMFNSGIDLAEYRNQSWVNWYGQTVKSLDPYGHPVSSRYGGGSGNLKMNGQTYNSVGERNSEIAALVAAFAPGDNVPASNNDNWSEDLANDINGHTVDDIRRAAWKVTVAGGVAFNIRHNTLFCPTGITECDRYFHIAQLENELDSEDWLALVNPFIKEHLGTTYATMVPAPALVDGGGGKYALADPNRNRILYFLMGVGDSWDGGDGGPIVVKLNSVSGHFSATWFDPRSGQVQNAPNLNGGNNTPLAPPTNQDWVLVLKRL